VVDLAVLGLQLDSKLFKVLSNLDGSVINASRIYCFEANCGLHYMI